MDFCPILQTFAGDCEPPKEFLEHSQRTRLNNEAVNLEWPITSPKHQQYQ